MNYSYTENDGSTKEKPWASIDAYHWQVKWNASNFRSFGEYFESAWSEFNEKFLPIILSDEKTLTLEQAEELWWFYFHKLLPMIVGFPPAYLKHITSQCFIALLRHLVRVGPCKIYLEDTYRHYRAKDVFNLGVIMNEFEDYLAANIKRGNRKLKLVQLIEDIELLYPQRFPGEKNYDIARMFAEKHSIPIEES